jgi:peroxiredoxin
MNGDITYYTNDPDEPSKMQEVYKNNTSFPQVGSPAPDFTLLGSDSNYHTLSSYQGKVVFLEFGGAW